MKPLVRRFIFLIRTRYDNILFFVFFSLVVLLAIWSTRISYNRRHPYPVNLELTDIDSLLNSSSLLAQNDSVLVYQRDTLVASSGPIAETNLPKQIPGKSVVARTTAPDAKLKARRSVAKPKKVTQMRVTPKQAPARSKTERGYGELSVVLTNAAEYGFAYVFINDVLWNKGGYNTTPIKITLPVGRYKVSVQRENFSCTPTDTTIIIGKDDKKQLSFTLIPRQKLTLSN